MSKVLACIDDSVYANSVCDHAVWAVRQLHIPLELLHAINRHPETATAADLSGNIGLGSQEALLEQLSELDEQRSKLAQERGRLLLEGVRQRALDAGLTDVETRQRHGALVETLTDMEADTRLFVVGKCGRSADSAQPHLGANLERAVRALHRPILVVTEQYQAMRSALIAFDGSATTRKGIEMIAASPLLQGMELHLLMVAEDNDRHRGQIRDAENLLAAAGFNVRTELRPGYAEQVIPAYAEQQQLSLLIMGAYGHSRIRQFIVGSTTTALLRTCDRPILLLR